MNPLIEASRWADHYRHWIGAMLELAGAGPSEAPHRVLLRGHLLTLRSYGGPQTGAAVLLVPAPIKRGYLWDILPQVSVVRRLLAQGFQVYAAYWEDPDSEGERLGLEGYVEELLRCVSATSVDSGGNRPVLLGHSLGGTLAALGTALSPSTSARLVLIGAPIDFGAGCGLLGRLTSGGERSGQTLPQGKTPGSFLGSISFAADPFSFGLARHLDRVSCLGDPLRLQTHLAVERWALDELPIAGRLLRDLLDMVTGNRFMAASLVLRGHALRPESIDVPVLAVMDPYCTVAPPESVLPFLRRLSCPENRIFWYSGEVGTSLRHVAPLVGRSAHASLWPRIVGWLETPGPESGVRRPES